MKTSPSRALHEKVVRLRRAYLAKLPQTLTGIRLGCARLVEDVAGNGVLDDLHRAFHNIKGTAASLGLPEISAEAVPGADLVIALRRWDVAGRQAALAATLAGLDACLAQLEKRESDARAQETAAPPPSAGAERAAATTEEENVRRRVVFYCDNALGSGDLGAQLSCFGYSFTSFTDPAALKAAVLADPPDAVIISTVATDIMADLRDNVAVPALFVSEQSGFDARMKAVKAGGEAYLLKPVAAHDIVDILDKVTTRHEPDPFRVLILDDEPEMADYHGLILETAGMIVHRIHQPTEILEELGEFQPDLVLMDMYMPTCSGRELSYLIRQIPRFVSLPIIFLSSETDRKVQISAMRGGADGFLTKPVVPEDLITAVIVRAERTRVLHSLMMQDSLTGLLNHTTLLQFLDTMLASARRNRGQLCFVMLDLDHFKRVNDTYGHPAGDQVLVALARMLKQRLRGSDMAGRYGGEEFALILQDVSVANAVAIVDKIRRDFAALIFPAGNAEFSCTFSGGVAGFPDVSAPERLVEVADMTLYAAKHGGRNQIRAAQSTGDSGGRP